MKRTSHFSLQILVIAFSAAVAAVNYSLFVFPNNFAPAGIDGLCTIIQYVFNVNIGSLSIIINIPLLILAYFTLNRGYAFKTLVYIGVFSLSSHILGFFDVSGAFGIKSELVFIPIAAGIIRGVLYASVNLSHGSSGGTDIIAAYIRRSRPDFDLMWIIFSLNLIVSVIAFFVYKNSYIPVLYSLVYCFTASFTGSLIGRSRKKLADRKRNNKFAKKVL